MPNNLTDADVKKALEICTKAKCKKCQYITESKCNDLLMQDALDLINRLTAENSNLTSDLTSLQNDLTSAKAEVERLNAYYKDEFEKMAITYTVLLTKKTQEIKAEAYKEFAERIKANAYYNMAGDNIVFSHDVDDILKEMVGEKL